MKLRQGMSLALAFVLGAVVTYLAPFVVRTAAEMLLENHNVEVARVTSPDGAVDAVMEVNDCGPACSKEYSIFIVPRGDSGASLGPALKVYSADDAAGGHISWSQPHLLVIAYDRALIRNFQNVIYPLGKSGDSKTWQYAVEARLAPSNNFSYLNGAK